MLTRFKIKNIISFFNHSIKKINKLKVVLIAGLHKSSERKFNEFELKDTSVVKYVSTDVEQPDPNLNEIGLFDNPKELKNNDYFC